MWRTQTISRFLVHPCFYQFKLFFTNLSFLRAFPDREPGTGLCQLWREKFCLERLKCWLTIEAVVLNGAQKIGPIHRSWRVRNSVGQKQWAVKWLRPQDQTITGLPFYRGVLHGYPRLSKSRLLLVSGLVLLDPGALALAFALCVFKIKPVSVISTDKNTSPSR